MVNRSTEFCTFKQLWRSSCGEAAVEKQLWRSSCGEAAVLYSNKISWNPTSESINFFFKLLIGFLLVNLVGHVKMH